MDRGQGLDTEVSRRALESPKNSPGREEDVDQETWRKISDVFADYVDCSVAERPAFLARLEKTEPALADEVRELLEVYPQDDDFLETPGIYQGDQFSSTREIIESGGRGQVPHELQVQRPRGSRRRSFFFWLLMVANVAFLGCFVFALSILLEHRGIGSDFGWSAHPTPQGWRITAVDNHRSAAGAVRVGDYVLEVNHQGIWLPELLRVRPGRPYSMRLVRQGRIQDVMLIHDEAPNRRWFGGVFSYLLVSLTYFITAVVVSVMQPRPRITRLAWAALSGEALTLLCMLVRPYQAFLASTAYGFFTLMQLIDGPHLAFSLHFYWRVFRGSRPSKGSFPFVVLLYVWGMAGALYRTAVLTRYSFSLVSSFFWSHLNFWRAADIFEDTFYLVAPLSICVAVAYSYWRAKDREERRRAGLIAAGSLAGITPYLVLRWAATTGLTAADYAGVYGVLPATLIPIATGYAILKHQLFDIHVVLRRGARYLVARNFLRFVLALPAVALAYSLVTNANRTVGEVVLHNSIFISLVVLIAVVLKFRGRLSTWLDRRFFREPHPQEHTLFSLIDSLRSVDSVPEMGRRVVEKLVEALHPESVHFFYYCADLRAYIKGFGTDDRVHALHIPENSALPDLLTKTDQPVNAQTLPLIGVPPMSWTWLRTLHTDLIVPLNRADSSTAGFLLLGPKKSDEPYSPADRTLLIGLARQMVLVYENLLLQDRLLQQRRTNEKIRARVENTAPNWLQECPQCGRCFDCSVRTCAVDGVELVFSLPVQRILDGRYHLDRVLGRGGMGTVFAAQDLRLNRQVAVKLVQAGRISDSAWLRRFSREARALARLQHGNIVLTHDFGVVEEEAAYLVMEFVPGSTLRTEINSGGIPTVTAAAWFHQLLEGLKAAHASGIVHRDLKPENVLIARTDNAPERVKIADFGVAKWLTPEPGSVTLTMPGTIVGSLQYMSPEQLAGESVDTRSDIFAIGVMAFEVVTGRVPFCGTNYAERIASILRDSQPLENFLKQAPALEFTLRKCMAKNPNERFPTAEALQAELIPQLHEYQPDTPGASECA
jgi:hypothetical protein